MTVIETALGTGPHVESSLPARSIERVLKAIIPAANPDFEIAYGSVCKWWIEVNPDGEPCRELGFDEQGAVIAAAPLDRNYIFRNQTLSLHRLIIG